MLRFTNLFLFQIILKKQSVSNNRLLNDKKKLDFLRFSILPILELTPKLTPSEFLKISFFFEKLEKSTGFLSKSGTFCGCGGRTRTYDLRVMSPTSFQLLYSAIFGCAPQCSNILAWGRAFVKHFFQKKQKTFLGSRMAGERVLGGSILGEMWYTGRRIFTREEDQHDFF